MPTRGTSLYFQIENGTKIFFTEMEYATGTDLHYLWTINEVAGLAWTRYASSGMRFSFKSSRLRANPRSALAGEAGRANSSCNLGIDLTGARLDRRIDCPGKFHVISGG